MDATFQTFGSTHLTTLASGAAGIALLLMLGKAGGTKERLARSLLAFLNLAAFGYSQAAWSSVEGGHDLDSSLPFHLCDVAAMVAGFALLSGRRLLVLLTYFWGLAATLQALATPAISVDFPHPAFLSFFVHHFAIVGAALYFPIVTGWRPATPWWKSPAEAWFWTSVYALSVSIVNSTLGTNFGFLARKPQNPSLLDHLGPWPIYLIWMAILAFAFFSLLVLPFRPWRRLGSPNR